MKKWWENQPLTICAVQCNLGDDDFWVLDEYVGKYGFNTEQCLHLFTRGHFATYSEEKHAEKLDQYLARAHEKGLKQICYYNTHCLEEAHALKHPEWIQRIKDGSPLKAYGVGQMVCVNPNGSWHKQYIKNIRALCSHDIDGIFLDGPVMREVGCYCEVCKRDFLERFGHPIEEATRLELQTMRVDNVTRHIQETKEVVDASGKDILLYMNNSALRADITGSNTRRVAPYVDMLGAEGGFYRPTQGVATWAITVKSKLLESIANGKPVVNFFAGNESGTAYYMHTAAETVMTYATSYANGANVWYGIHGSPSMFKDSDGAKAAKAMNKFILSHTDLYRASTSTAKVALMWSQDTANNYGSGYDATDFTEKQVVTARDKGDHYGELIAFADMLIHNHVQFDVIDDTNVVHDEIQKYDVIILPNTSCMSEETARKLDAFVQKGGTLVATYDSACFDEKGVWLKEARLAKTFGLTGTPTLQTSPTIGYMKANGKNELNKNISAPFLPNPRLNLAWSLAEGSVPLFDSYAPLPGPYVNLPDKTYPGIVLNRRGKGRAYYFAGNFADFVAKTFPTADYAKIINNLVLSASKSVVTVDTSGLVEAVLRRIDDRYVLHLVNKTGAMTRPITEITPLYNLKITLNLPAAVNKIKPVRGGKISKLVQKGKKVSFTLDKLDAYEVMDIR